MIPNCEIQEAKFLTLCLSIIVVGLVVIVAAALIGLWAMNKPHHPAACSGMSPFDCTALVQEARK